MNLFRILVCGILSLTMPTYSAPSPLPVPKNIRIESAERRKEVWNRLSQQEKQLAFHLLEAARLGRELLFHQNHRHGRTIKRLIETALSGKEINKTKTLLGKSGFQEFVVYSAKFLDQSGPYSSSNRKYILTKVSDKQLTELMKRHLVVPSLNDLTEIKKLLIDPGFEVERQPEDPKGTGLEAVGGNLYEKGITAEEVQAALSKGLEPTLNCRIVKQGGKLTCEKQTVELSGFVGTTLQQIVEQLKKAEGVSVSKEQKNQIKATIKYLEKGDVEDFREANIAWVKDRSQSPVDFMMGWVEVYEDFLAKIGSWETYVQVVDPEVSKVAQNLATHAQHFENGMPYGKFKKTFPKDYSPPAIMVYYFQEISSYRTGGYNLPNFDDIRRDVGAKNVIRLPLPGESQSPDIRAIWNEVLEEFGPPDKKDTLMKAREKVYRVMVLLHEIIGHGSGTYDESKFKKNEDPISALGSLASALEEQRADLTALVFAGDQALIAVGLYKDKGEAQEMLKAQYDLYLVDFLRRTSGQRTFTEAHQRGHWLFVNKLLEKGAVEWAAKKKQPKTLKNQILRVKDYDKFHQVAVELLGELQRIKANREEQALVKLFDSHAPLDAIKEPWAQAIIERGKDLKINAGYVEQPWRVNSQLVFESFGGTTLETIAPFFEKMNAETPRVEKN
ncbi:MAG: hypothetical protein EBQ92_10020 [Proteobacteria bacterium]|nr:hypothetical protein [Pseudomonadota bacterium]